MSTQKDILRLLKSVMQHRRGARDVEMMYPAREWYLGLGGVLVMLIIGALLSYQAYERIQVISSAVPTVLAPSVPYEAAVVEEAIGFFSEKQRKYESYKGSTIINDNVVNPVAEAPVVTVPTSTPTTTAPTTETPLPSPVVEQLDITTTTTPEVGSPTPSALF
ncbi:MAG: hypothetical protein RLZZ70_439 [Candidatus Parcubacteria bacterium]|jgi:hypothetical protein